MKGRATKIREIVALLEELSPEGLDAVHAFAQKQHAQEQGVALLVNLSPEEFAARVQQAANRSRNGWPNAGDDKVFVSVLFRELAGTREAAGLDLETFKSKLLDAHRKARLSLARCDLVQAADPADVAESEIAYLSATWHVVLRRR